MPSKKSDYDPIPWEETVAEWMKDPEFVREYEALEDEFAPIYRRIAAKKARRARRKALVRRVRNFWATLMRGLDRIAY